MDNTTRRVWIFILCLIITFDGYFHICVYHNILKDAEKRKSFNIFDIVNAEKKNKIPNQYPLIKSMNTSLEYDKSKYNSSYYRFMAMKHLFKDIGEEIAPIYPNNTALCQLNTTLERIFVNKTQPKLEWIEQQNPDVKLGGYYAPAHCRATNRVAVIIPYRNRQSQLYILLRYLHPLLKKQLLEYRIFLIEQSGKKRFNKGILYNIAFLETQRFGTWHCLIFHDVDLIPEDERISYSCPQNPTHMSPAVEVWGHKNIFSGVTAITSEQYEAVNGYSNRFLDWGVDEDFYKRVQLHNITVETYNTSIARYSTLSQRGDKIVKERHLQKFGVTTTKYNNLFNPEKDGLTTTKYNLLNVTYKPLYTHFLADVEPMAMLFDEKCL